MLKWANEQMYTSRAVQIEILVLAAASGTRIGSFLDGSLSWFSRLNLYAIEWSE